MMNGAIRSCAGLLLAGGALAAVWAGSSDEPPQPPLVAPPAAIVPKVRPLGPVALAALEKLYCSPRAEAEALEQLSHLHEYGPQVQARGRRVWGDNLRRIEIAREVARGLPDDATMTAEEVKLRIELDPRWISNVQAYWGWSEKITRDNTAAIRRELDQLLERKRRAGR